MIILLSFNKAEPFAEDEVVLRFKKVLENLGEEVLLVNSEHKNIETNQTINTKEHEIKFAISLHITIPPIPNIINYLCIWDPFVWRRTYQYTKKILQYDDYLLIDTPSLTKPVKSLVRRFLKKRLVSFNYLPPTLSVSQCESVSMIKHRKLFYCGIGGDQVGHCKSRLNGVLKEIDSMDLLELYGPEEIKDPFGSWVAPWGDYQSYRGSIPFDGESLIKKMHASGITLVISSPYHRQENIPSARIYEACASGNVIITDNNKYFNRWSKNIYQINFDKKTHEIKAELINCINKINNNPKKAFSMAQKSQKLFCNKFNLERYFKKILNDHPKRKSFHKRFRMAKQQQKNRNIIYRHLISDWDFVFYYYIARNAFNKSRNTFNKYLLKQKMRLRSFLLSLLEKSNIPNKKTR